MKTLRKKMYLMGLIAVSILSVNFAEQGKQPKRKLQFITSDEHEILDASWEQNIGISKPTHIAVLKFTSDTAFPYSQLRIIESNKTLRSKPTRTLVRTPALRRRLSHYILKEDSTFPQPLEFVCLTQTQTAITERGGPLSYIPHQMPLFLYANSEKEARKLTEAFIEICDMEASDKLQAHKKKMAETRNAIAEAEKKIPKLEAESKQLEKQLEEKVKEYAKANYGKEDEDSIYLLTEKHMEELANSLRSVNFELIGLDAKINSINKYKKSEIIIDDETLIKLNQILIATDIERAGALARKEAYEAALKLAKELYDLFKRRDKVNTDNVFWQRRLSTVKSDLRRLEQISEDPPWYMRPVEVYENIVVIKPIRQD